MIMLWIPLVVWIVWILIGFCAGYFTSRTMLGGNRSVFLSIAGIVGAICGGLILMELVDDPMLMKWQYVSQLTAVAGACLVVWPAWLIARKRSDHIDDDDQ